MAINKFFGALSNPSQQLGDIAQTVRKVPTISGSIESITRKIPLYDQVASKGALGITIDDLLQTGRCFPELDRFFNDLKRRLNDKIRIINRLLALIWSIIDTINALLEAINKYGLFELLWNTLMMLLNQVAEWLVKMGLKFIMNKLYEYIKMFNKFLNSSALMKRIRCIADAILTNNDLPSISSVINTNRNTISLMLNTAQKQFLMLVEKMQGFNRGMPSIQSILKPLQGQANNQLIKDKVPGLGNLSKDPFQIMKGKAGGGLGGFKF